MIEILEGKLPFLWFLHTFRAVYVIQNSLFIATAFKIHTQDLLIDIRILSHQEQNHTMTHTTIS